MEKRSWLSGPEIPSQFDDDGAPSRWPGEKLGLPEHGEGSLASVMRRVGGITIDWFFAMFIAIIIGQLSGNGQFYAPSLTLGIFVIISIVSVALFARTPGHMMLRMGVARIDAQERVGLWRSVVRAALTVFISPQIIVDADGRGLHDRATGTAVILG